MFCSECGSKNKQGDLFCQECGASLKNNEEEPKKSSPKETTPRKSMSKKQKIIISVVAVVVVAFGVSYKIIGDKCNPKNIAKEYIQAVVSNDADKIYQYFEIEGDKTFVSKKIFKELLKDEKSDIENFAVSNIKDGQGNLSRLVSFTYTTKNSSSEKTGTITLKKQKGKKFFFFDNWKVDTGISASVVKDYTIKVPKDASITFAGVKVDKKYKDEDASTDTLDAYKLPQVFSRETNVKLQLSSGMELELDITPSLYYSNYTVNINRQSLSKKETEKITKTIKEAITTIYNSGIERKSFDDIKSNFEKDDLDLTDFSEEYASFIEDLEDASNQLTSIDFTDVELTDFRLNDDNELQASVKVSYKYSIKYKSLFSDEEETRDDSTYSYMTFVLGYKDGEYHIVKPNNLVTYFSRY